MGKPKAGIVVVLSVGVVVFGSLASAQVFPPRQPQPFPAPVTPPGQAGQMPSQPPMPPQAGGAPGFIAKTIPFAAILGDTTKAFIQIGNMRSSFDTNFALGRGLAGRIALEKYTDIAGNGQRSYIHVSGVSNPPIVMQEGSELRLQFVFPLIQFKTYYRDYSGEGDSALSDLVAEKVVVDVFIKPTIDQRRLPTYHSVRVAVSGSVKEAKKCTHFFDIFIPVNICSAVAEYFKQIQPAIENGMRELLLQPQTRIQFDEQVAQYIRAELLAQAGVNPMSPAQIQILQSSFQGTDYHVQYLPTPQ